MGVLACYSSATKCIQCATGSGRTIGRFFAGKEKKGDRKKDERGKKEGERRKEEEKREKKK
jgi:hypothetical protein